MKNWVLIIGAFITLTAVTGCSNTFDGVGQDLNKTGDWLQDTF